MNRVIAVPLALVSLVGLAYSSAYAQRGGEKQKASKAADQAFVNSIGMKLVAIPAGTFMMGSPETENNGNRSNEDLHEVTITKGFYMGVYEVTQAQYQKVMGDNPSFFKGDDLPVENASWNDAAEFCKRLSELENKSYRLPTEAEWEYACRAGTTTAYHYGENLTSAQANCNGSPKGVWLKKTTPGGSYQPNAFGLYDMHGNVWEWCQDFYGGSYKDSPKEDPQGPNEGGTLVLRGGSWDYPFYICRAATHIPGAADFHRNDVGFRVVSVLPPTGVKRLALKEVARWELEDDPGSSDIFWEFTPNGKSLLFGTGTTSGSGFTLWDVDSKTSVKIPDLQAFNNEGLFGDGRWVLPSGDSQRFWSGQPRWLVSVDARTGALQTATTDRERYEYAMTASLDGRTVFVGSRSGDAEAPLVFALDPVSMKEERAGVSLKNARVHALAWSAALNAIVGAIETRKTMRLVVIDPKTLEVKQTVFDERPGDGATSTMLLSPDGGTVGERLSGATLRIWDLTTGKQTSEYKGDQQVLKFAGSGQFLLTNSGYTQYSVFDLGMQRVRHEIDLYKVLDESNPRTAVSTDGCWLVSGDQAGRVAVRNVMQGKAGPSRREPWLTLAERDIVQVGKEAIASVAITPTGKRIATAQSDGTIIVFDVEYRNGRRRGGPRPAPGQ
jgi:formylglycine-generating enzyme required for sulfatase activity/WD40 repeat protein